MADKQSILLKQKDHKEYNFLLNFYTELAGLEPITSTFLHMTTYEKLQLIGGVKNLMKIFGEILPKVQDREKE